MGYFSNLRDDDNTPHPYSLAWSPDDDPSPLKIPRMGDDVRPTEKFILKWYLDGWLHLLRQPQDYPANPRDRSSYILDQWNGDSQVVFLSPEFIDVLSQTEITKLKNFLDQLSIGIEQLAPDTVLKVPYRDVSDVYDEMSDFLSQIGEISEINLSTSVDEEFFNAWLTDKELALDKAKFGRPKLKV